MVGQGSKTINISNYSWYHGISEKYQIKKVWDRSLACIWVILVLGVHDVPALTILYISNSHQPVYLGSLRRCFYGYGIPKSLIYTIFLLFETMMVLSVVCNGLLYAFLFITILQSSLFWIQELT